MLKLVLASQSPRRRELLAHLGYSFEIVSSTKEEIISSTVPSEVVCELSRQKALDVFENYEHLKKHGTDKIKGSNADKNPESGSNKDNYADKNPESGCNKGNYGNNIIVIGADTIVACDGEILGKPGSKEEAYKMLYKLQGRAHEVYTGVTIVKRGALKSFFECTKVKFYPMSDVEIWDYINSGDPMDKAGAYGIQSGAAIFIEKIDGDYNNVVGLPVARLYHQLKDMIND